MAELTNVANFREYMPCIATDRDGRRRLRCSICEAERWTTWGQARRHWLSHSEEERRKAIVEAKDD